jgi:hypothetical protein
MKTTTNPKETQGALSDNTSFKIRAFLDMISISTLLRLAHIQKAEGVHPIRLLISLMTLVFSGQNFFRVYQSGSEGFKTDTVYRFLNNPRFNWRNLLLSSARILIHQHIDPLTSDKRVTCYILDSTVYQRLRSKKVELLSWVYDHMTGLTVRGFQKVLLAWTDGYSTIPLQHALLASSKDSKRLCGRHLTADDKRSPGQRRRIEAVQSMPDVAIAMLKRAKRWKIQARYVLMDSWFTYPKTILAIRALRIHVIGIIKKTPTVHYLYQEKKLDILKIYRSLKKRRGRAAILASTMVQLEMDGDAVKLIFVRNRNKKGDWLVLLSTDATLPDEEIIRIYGYRWNIEVLFKVTKHFLNLTGEIQSRRYDAMIAHSTIVLLRFCFLEFERRIREDGRSHGELFYACYDEIRDLSFFESLKLLISVFIEEIQNCHEFTENAVQTLIDTLFKSIKRLFPQLLEQGCGS